MEELLTVKEVMAYLKVSKTTVYKLIDREKIRPIKIGAVTRIKKEDIEKLLEGE